ncbi:hypothetical protein VPFG_00300 [Vibrio phage nt-1]|uniref:Uncharacterized protein n=1 Tax=Vibrio phage nt-1 TaxID=115992 RepID=R9TFN7_9CAUD|nr:hypothetical protein VPFG_00300 [Vibrio phage nt-1]AGN30299.2 hypothetical protein VPFG_00300 [Vibrio phage nt-1]
MTTITVMSDTHYGHNINVKESNLVTAVMKKLLSDTDVSYYKLYREKRTSKHRSNIDGKSVRFFGCYGKDAENKLQTVLRDFNDLFSDSYVAELQTSYYGRRKTIQIFRK